MRETSLRAYEEIQRDGTLGRMQKLALGTLIVEGPSTGRELSRAARSEGLWKRLSELESRGYIRAGGTRKCRVTGKTVTEWVFWSATPKADAEAVQPRLFACGRRW